MIGEKKEPEEDFDLHRCFNCGTIVHNPDAPSDDG